MILPLSHEWQPLLQELAKQLLKVQNRHEQLYRKASFMYTQAKSDRARIAALNLMRQINVESAQLSGVKPTEQTQTEETRIKWEDPRSMQKTILIRYKPHPGQC